MRLLGILHPLILPLGFIIVSHILCSCGSWAFSSCQRLPTNTRNAISCGKHRFDTIGRSRALRARPPPTSSFDLEAIEAFEATMDFEQAQEQSDDANDDDSDDDLEDSSTGRDNSRLFTVPAELHGIRIDAVLAALEPSLSRSVCGNLIAEGCVHLVVGDREGEPPTSVVLDRKSQKVEAGNTLRVILPTEETPDQIVAQNLPLNILYEDEHMIVINKAAGMVVHPAAGNWDGTVVNALAYYLAKESRYGAGDFVDYDGSVRRITTAGTNGRNSNNADDPAGADGERTFFRPGIVHRLDKGTTGILIVAKTSQALSILSAAFAARQVKKTYLAITVGNPGKQVAIDKPIGRHPIHRQRMRVVPDPHRKDSSGVAPKDRIPSISSSSSYSKAGRRALSYVDTIAFDGKLSLVQVRIETGRTHQIRVHLQDRKTPIYGDDVYGIADWNKRLVKSNGIQRPLLHAYRLELEHPITREKMVFEAPMAEDMSMISMGIWQEGPEELPAAFSPSVQE